MRILSNSVRRVCLRLGFVPLPARPSDRGRAHRLERNERLRFMRDLYWSMPEPIEVFPGVYWVGPWNPEPLLTLPPVSAIMTGMWMPVSGE